MAFLNAERAIKTQRLESESQRRAAAAERLRSTVAQARAEDAGRIERAYAFSVSVAIMLCL